MTHFPSKRLSRPGVSLAAGAGPVAALGLGTLVEAHAAPATAAAAPRWSDRAHGFAAPAGGTAGVAGGKAVTGRVHHLGRPWRPGGEPAPVARVPIRGTEPPATVEAAPWTGMSGLPWRDARFAEYRYHGPGAAVSADRPRPNDTEARTRTAADHLRGTDDLAPHARR